MNFLISFKNSMLSYFFGVVAQINLENDQDKVLLK